MEVKYIGYRALKGSVIFAMLAFLSILFIDKTLSLLIHNNHIDIWALDHGFRHITENLPVILPYMGLLLIVFVKPQIDIGNRVFYIIYLYGLTLLTVEIKQLLKNIFGRYWPQTWIKNNLSLIHNGVYGFDWFHGMIHHNGSFPSGHTTFVAIICLSLAIIYPKLSKLAYLIIAIMVFCLVILNYHYLGDCFGALSLCIICANLGFVIYRALVKRLMEKFSRINIKGVSL